MMPQRLGIQSRPNPLPRRHYQVQSISQASSVHPNTLTPASSITTSSPIPYGARPRKSVLGKRSRERLLATDLLTADEGVHSHSDRAVDVCCAAVLAQTHFGEGFADTEDGFEMADLVAC